MTTKLLIDLDGVIADTLPHWLEYNRLATGIEARPEDITAWALSDCPVYGNVPDKQILWVPMTKYKFWETVPVMEGAVEFIDTLLSDGIPFNFVTAPANGVSCQAKYDWVATHFPKAKKNLIITSDKASVRGTVLIDDRDKNVVDFFRDNPEAELAFVPKNAYQDKALLATVPAIYTSRVPDWESILSCL